MDLDYYQEIIIGHHKSPVGFKSLEQADYSHFDKNQFCADEFKVSVKVDGSFLSDLAIEGQGCAISRASASIMGSILKGQSIMEVNKSLSEYISAFSNEIILTNLLDSDEIRALLIVKGNVTKQECALLPWKILSKCLELKNGQP